jgi:predicted acylesterase/phospholipase RssA
MPHNTRKTAGRQQPWTKVAPNNGRGESMKHKKKRAIALAGGGPAAGLHIGALAELEDRGIEFDVFALSCIGAWVGIVYNTRSRPKRAADPSRAQQTLEFFDSHCFRDDRSYAWFPINRGFATDVQSLWQAWAKFPASPDLDWNSLVLPLDIYKSFLNSTALFADPTRWTNQEFNYWLLNDVLAVNPFTRYLTSMIYNSKINGLSKIFYEDSPVLKKVFRGERGECLYGNDMPEIYHNAWRLPREEEPGKMQIFHNRGKTSFDVKDPDAYLRISPESLCACSALPFIEESVFIEPYEYIEGALVDTVNFANLLRDHPDLDEVWINRIVDDSQVKSPRGLAGALANLPMQFAAEVGENDIKLFRQHLLNQSHMRPRVVEIPIRPDTGVTFEWKHSNLMQGYSEGRDAVRSLLEFDEQLSRNTVD